MDSWCGSGSTGVESNRIEFDPSSELRRVYLRRDHRFIMGFTGGVPKDALTLAPFFKIMK